MKKFIFLFFVLLSVLNCKADSNEDWENLVSELEASALLESDEVILLSQRDSFLSAKTNFERVDILLNLADEMSDSDLANIVNDNAFLLLNHCLSKKIDKTDYANLNSLLGWALRQKMYSYQKKGDEYTALIYAFNVLKVKEKFSDQEGVGRAYLDIGTCYYVIGNTQKSIDYFLKAYSILKNYETNDVLTTLLNNLGVVYGGSKEYSTALKYQKESIRRCVEIGHDFGKGMSLNNIGGIYYQVDSFALGYLNL